MPRAEQKLNRKIVALFTEREHEAIMELAQRQDRSAGNLMHYVMREYVAGRLVPAKRERSQREET